MSPNPWIFGITLLLAILVASPDNPEPEHAKGTTEVESVRRFFDNWIAAERDHDIGRLLDAVDDDCVFLLPGQEPLKGKQQVRQMYESFFQTYGGAAVDHRVSVEDVQIAGNYAFFWGVDELKISRPDGQVVQARGYGIGILKRGVDGRWKSYRSMNNMTRQPS
jgi:uncharacterized protein (TIGR02246 family)